MYILYIYIYFWRKLKYTSLYISTYNSLWLASNVNCIYKIGQIKNQATRKCHIKYKSHINIDRSFV